MVLQTHKTFELIQDANGVNDDKTQISRKL